MGLLSNPVSRLAALIALVAIGVALSGIYPVSRLNSKAAVNTDLIKFVHLLFVAASVSTPGPCLCSVSAPLMHACQPA